MLSLVLCRRPIASRVWAKSTLRARSWRSGSHISYGRKGALRLGRREDLLLRTELEISVDPSTSQVQATYDLATYDLPPRANAKFGANNVGPGISGPRATCAA